LKVEDTLPEFLIRNKNAKGKLLCPRCTVVFGKVATKSLEKFEYVRKSHEDAAHKELDKGKQQISMFVNKIQNPANFYQGKSNFVPQLECLQIDGSTMRQVKEETWVGILEEKVLLV